jgi:hypothetical protein
MNDIGCVQYTRNWEHDSLDAIWFYRKDSCVSGTGIAKGHIGEGFEGEYEVTYFSRDGIELSKLKLVVARTFDHYELKWLVGDEVKFVGIGMQVKDTLYAGWRAYIPA